MDSRDHVGAEQFVKLNMTNVEKRVSQLKLNHIHNIFYDKCPDYLKDEFVRISHGYNTRNSSMNFFVPRITGCANESFFYSGILLWNSFPAYIRQIQDRNLFKKYVKKHLINLIVTEETENFIYY